MCGIVGGRPRREKPRSTAERGEWVERYSTVTDFARLRGWSTSVPMITAVW